jgi:putative ABC transport system permease protein
LLYLATIAISLLVAMCVLTTLTASVIERRKDFAVMKALGASQNQLMSMFIFEAATQAGVGGIVGYILGTIIAAWIGKTNFGSIVLPQFQLFIPVLFGTLFIAALSALLPLNILRHVEPAAILKGE